MQKVLTCAQMRAADEYTIRTLGVPSQELMERAGAALAEEARHVQPPPDPEYRFCDDINYNLSLILSGYCRKASITYFVPDPVKPGGCYRSVYDEVCGADGDGRTIILKSGTRIALDSVTWIEPDIGSQDIEY